MGSIWGPPQISINFQWPLARPGAKIAFAEPGVQIKPLKPNMGLSGLQIANLMKETSSWIMVKHIQTCLTQMFPGLFLLTRTIKCVFFQCSTAASSGSPEVVRPRRTSFRGPKVGCEFFQSPETKGVMKVCGCSQSGSTHQDLGEEHPQETHQFETFWDDMYLLYSNTGVQKVCTG